MLLTRGRPTVIPPETWLTFRLKEPVTVDTTQSAHAFLPVSQYDYDGGRRGSRYQGGYAPQGAYAQGPYACGYDTPCYPPPTYAYPYGLIRTRLIPGYYYGCRRLFRWVLRAVGTAVVVRGGEGGNKAATF